MENPLISVVIPTFNEEERLKACLESIKNQSYPSQKIEILIVDDGSQDRTLEIAKKYKTRIFFSGLHNIERSKSIGVENAKGEYIFLIDADNRLTNKLWFSSCLDIFSKSRSVVGIEAWRIKYKKRDGIVNRYSALIGVMNPMVYYLGKWGFLSVLKDNWPEKNILKEERNYTIVKYDLADLPTLGSNGYMTKKSLILKTRWKPYLFHMDSIHDLVAQGHGEFARLKFDIEHDYAESLLSLFKKLYRNIDLFMKYKKLRRYKYNLNYLKTFEVFFIMGTFVIPLYDSLRGYLKKQDNAWFIHPFVCFVTVLLYTFAVIKRYLK